MNIKILKAICYAGAFGGLCAICIPGLMSIPASAIGGYLIGMMIAKGEL